MGSGIDGGGNARRNAHEKINRICTCGRRVNGNGRAHERTCEVNLAQKGWPLPASMKGALREEYPIGTSHIIRYVEFWIGQVYLQRRRDGIKGELPWIEFRDLVWKFAEAAANPEGSA